MSVKEKLVVIINEVLKGKGGQPLLDIDPTTILRDELNFDSFDLAELTVRVEDEFGKDIFANGLVNTFGEILEIVSCE